MVARKIKEARIVMKEIIKRVAVTSTIVLLNLEITFLNLKGLST